MIGERRDDYRIGDVCISGFEILSQISIRLYELMWVITYGILAATRDWAEATRSGRRTRWAMKFGGVQGEVNWNKAKLNHDARRVGCARARRQVGFLLVVLCGFACLAERSRAQAIVPFEVSNPKHLSWSVEEAGRIYDSACRLMARSVRPEQSQLQPKFVLVLGAKADQMVRADANSEIHLRKWDPARFAEALVMLTLRDVVKNEDVIHLAREALNAAESTASVNELRQKK